MASRTVSSAVAVIAAAGVERREAGRSGAFPVERDVLGRVEGVVELEAMRVYREDRRLAPGDELRSGAGLAARCIHQLRKFSGRAGGAADRLGPRLDLADDLDAPMSEIGSDFVGDLGALDAAALPPPGEAFVDPAGKTAGAAADDRRKRRHLPVAGMFVDIHAANPSRLSCPEVALPTADAHKAQIVEFDVAVMALADVPKQHRLAKTVVGRLGEGARAGNRAAAVVEPLARGTVRDLAGGFRAVLSVCV